MFAESRCISVLEVVPRSLWCADFDSGERLDLYSLKNPDSNLTAIDALLNQNPLIVRERLLKSPLELALILWKGDSQRGALSGRFDYHIQAKSFDNLSRRRRNAVAAIHNHVPGNWKAGISEQMLGNDLIHSAGTSVHPASHIRKAECFQESLKRPIFPGRAVQHWEY